MSVESLVFFPLLRWRLLVYYFFTCWCWTLKSPRSLLINSLEQQKHPMGQGGIHGHCRNGRWIPKMMWKDQGHQQETATASFLQRSTGLSKHEKDLVCWQHCHGRVENTTKVYTYLCVMYENMHKDDDIWWPSVTFLQHSNHALLASRICISAAISFFHFKSKPLSFQIEREKQLSTVTLWSRRPDVKLTLFASAASSALLQLFSCMSCETGPSLQRARRPGQDLWGSFPAAQCAFHLPRSLWGVVGLHPSLKYIRANYSRLPYPSQPASPKIQSAFLHPKMQISALGLLSLK